MFTFINTSRVGTAVQGVAAAEKGFQHAPGTARSGDDARPLREEGAEGGGRYHWQPAVRQMLPRRGGGRGRALDGVRVRRAILRKLAYCLPPPLNAPPRLPGARCSPIR